MTTTSRITRNSPNASLPFLRFQVGRMIERPERIPKYKGLRLDGHHDGFRSVTVFRIEGWGESEAKAVAMAVRSESRKANQA